MRFVYDWPNSRVRLKHNTKSKYVCVIEIINDKNEI